MNGEIHILKIALVEVEEREEDSKIHMEVV
jgi:hypothetical protein